MKKTFASMVLVALLWATPALAHSLFMTISDNSDGTITVEGMYSTGATAAFTEVRLEDAQGNVLFKGKTDEFGELIVNKQPKPYTVILDAGPGHVASEKGPQ
ncbi:MAG: hypothetical protein ACNI3A_10730 [Desulfovibrio sp.]|uniref:hypothetical protein n=1 Tax=Desulfovibrio sp. 7SRBS1 TaxID=3378064 RepID=UPI003B423A06